MDSEGLTFICSGLGKPVENLDGVIIGYEKNEYCLDNLKDLQRYLRRDDPQQRKVFKQLCKWKTVSNDIIPILEFFQGGQNLAINAVKVLVFLTMPVDPASDDVSQQLEYLWGLKTVLSRNTTIAVIVSLLEEPLDHLETDMFTEDDWKLVQLVLTLFRNLLAIHEVSLQQKASGSATQILSVRDRFIEIMFAESVMDIILVLIQHLDDSSGFLYQDNLLFLEIISYIFVGQDPGLIAEASQVDAKEDGNISASLVSLLSIIEDEAETRRSIRRDDLGRHSEFSGTFSRCTVDGSKTLYKGNPGSACKDGLLKPHKVQRGQLKRTAWDKGSLSLPKFSTLELLSSFLTQFLSGGYNVLMKSVREDIEKEYQAIQHSDVILFFQVAQFTTAFQYKASILKKPKIEDTLEASADQVSANDLFSGDVCGPIAATMNETMFYLVISKWREAFECLKETQEYKTLSAAGSLMKYMIRMLDLILKILPEDSKEPQTARVLLYKIFYDQTDQGFTQFLLNLFKSFDSHKQPKSDLADLLEVIHVAFRLMEKLQARGTLKVARKSRKSRKKKTFKDKNQEAEAGRIIEESDVQVADKFVHGHEGPISNSDPDIAKLTEEQLADSNKDCIPEPALKESCLNLQTDHKSPGCLDEKSKVACDGEHETEDSACDDQPTATNEVDFNMTRLITNFANNVVVRNICWLLKYYKGNSVSTNHHIISMLRRICVDLDLSPMLYQLSVLTTFYDILADKASKSKEHANIIDFVTKFTRKMLKTLKNQPMLFIDILFWKTRKECHCISAGAMKHQIRDWKKEVRSWENEEFEGSSRGRGQGWRSIADALGDDEADFGSTNDHNIPMEDIVLGGQTLQSDYTGKKEQMLDTQNKEQMQEHIKSANPSESGFGVWPLKASGKRKHLTQEQVASSEDINQNHARKRIRAFSYQQEAEVRALFEQFKDNRRCSYMIANSLDGGNKYSAAQVSRKLRQLGLVPNKRMISKAGNKLEDGQLTEVKQLSDEETPIFRKRSKRIDASAHDNSMAMSEHDSDNVNLDTLLKRKRNKLSSHEDSKAGTSDHDSDNEILVAMIKSKGRLDSDIENDKHASDSSNESKRVPSPDFPKFPQEHGDDEQVGSGSLDDGGTQTELGSTSLGENRDEGYLFDKDVLQVQQMHDDSLLEDSSDSDDDSNKFMQKKAGRRTLKMVIDAEDDEKSS